MNFSEPVRWPEGQDLFVSDVVVRWTSEPRGLWRVDIARVFYGFRAKLARRAEHTCGEHHLDRSPLGDFSRPQDWPGYEVVYCMGANQLALLLLPRMMLKVLERFDEAAPLDAVRSTFPEQSRKPMHNDPECWAKLSSLCGVPDGESVDLDNGVEIELEPHPALAGAAGASPTTKPTKGPS